MSYAAGNENRWIVAAAIVAMATGVAYADVLQVDGSGRVRIDQATILGAGSLIPDGGEAFTIEAWINPDTHAQDSITGWGTRTNNLNNGFRLGSAGDGLAFTGIRHYFWANDGDRETGDLSPSTTGYAADGWNHLVITWDGVSTRQIYLNGVQVGANITSGVPNVTINGDGLTIGSAQNSTEGFNGQIDEVRIWNTNLNSQQLRTNYNRELTGSESNLVAYWNFESAALDASGNGHNGSLEGDATIVSGNAVATSSNNGIVGYWTFNDASNIGKATIGKDLNANNGAGSTTGAHGGAVSLDGSNQSLSLGGALPANLPLGDGSYTVSAWINTTEAGGANSAGGIVGWGGYGTGGQVNATRLQGTSDLVNYGWGGANDIQRNSGGTIADGTWRHVAAVYDAATGLKTLYVDGVQIGSSMAVPDLNVMAGNFAIGVTNGAEFFNGAIDDVAISNQALGSDIIRSIANGASAVNAPLVSLWRFDDADDLGRDSSLLRNDVTGQNGVAYSAVGKFGGAASFDGVNDLFTRAEGVRGLPLGDSEYTIAAWLNADTTGAKGIIGWGNYGTGNQVTALRLDGDNGISHYWWGADLVPSSATVSGQGVDFDQDGWVHLAVTYDGTTRTIWLNGIAIAFDTPGAHNAQDLNFAIGKTFGGEYFDGLLDDVALFNLALDQTALLTVMGGNFDAYGVPAPAALPAGLMMIAALAGRRRGSRVTTAQRRAA